MRKIIFGLIAILGISLAVHASTRYMIEVNHNDDFFIINGEKFSALTYCFNGFDKGDYVIFIEGSPFGACATAKILSLRTHETCELWCE